MAKKLNYDMIPRWGEYKYRCEMEVFFSAIEIEQINDYLFIDFTNRIK